MRNDLTYLILLLDKSGSMESVRNATIEGTNSYINKQQQVPGDAVLHVVQFDDRVTVSHNYVNLKDAQPFNYMNYQPQGGTALLDAIGSTIDSVGAKLAAMSEDERPGKVIFVIQTDGEENASKVYNRYGSGYAKIQEKIRHQTEVYDWDFVFLGANQDAIASASNLGIQSGKALSYLGTNEGTRTAFGTIESYTTSVRGVAHGDSLKSVTFSQADRDANKTP